MHQLDLGLIPDTPHVPLTLPEVIPEHGARNRTTGHDSRPTVLSLCHCLSVNTGALVKMAPPPLATPGVGLFLSAPPLPELSSTFQPGLSGYSVFMSLFMSPCGVNVSVVRCESRHSCNVTLLPFSPLSRAGFGRGVSRSRLRPNPAASTRSLSQVWGGELGPAEETQVAD